MLCDHAEVEIWQMQKICKITITTRVAVTLVLVLFLLLFCQGNVNEFNGKAELHSNDTSTSTVNS